MARQKATGSRQQGEGKRQETRGKSRKATGNSQQSTVKHGYVLLETVIATGMLIVGLAVIGAQLQQSETSLRQMERRFRAKLLAESMLAELDLGVVPLDRVERLLDGDFGPRFPDWGWTMQVEPTAIDGFFGIGLTVWHHLRDGEYAINSFDFELAETLFATHAFLRVEPPIPPPPGPDGEPIELPEGAEACPCIVNGRFDDSCALRPDREELIPLCYEPLCGENGIMKGSPLCALIDPSNPLPPIPDEIPPQGE